MPPMTRRRLIQGSSLLAVSALLSACGKGEEEKIKPEEFWKTPGSPTKEYYGFIDESGSWAIPPQFSNLSYFSEDGVAPVLLRRYIEEQSKACVYSGIIDTSGEWAIEPKVSVGDNFLQPFCAANSFVGEPYAMAPSLVDKERDICHYGLIDKRGDWLIEPRFKYLDAYFDSGQRNVGLAVAAESGDSGESLCGFIDNEGNWAIPPTFRSALTFVGEYAWVGDTETGLVGLITQDGQWAIPPKYQAAFSIDATRAFARDPQSNLVGVLDLFQDSWILEPRWYHAWTESSNTYVMAMTEKGGPVGIYAMDTGETVLEPAYKSLSYASSYLIAAQELEGGLWGYIDIGGTWVIKPSFKDAYSFRNGLACASPSE